MKTLKERVLEGEIGIRNDGTLEQTNEVLYYVFPDDKDNVSCGFYLNSSLVTQIILDVECPYKNSWIMMFSDEPQLPDYPVAEFLKEIERVNQQQ